MRKLFELQVRFVSGGFTRDIHDGNLVVVYFLSGFIFFFLVSLVIMFMLEPTLSMSTWVKH